MEAVCSECKKSFVTKIACQNHIKTICKNAEVIIKNKKISCEFCDKLFSTRPNLLKHHKSCKAKKEFNTTIKLEQLEEKVKHLEKNQTQTEANMIYQDNNCKRTPDDVLVPEIIQKNDKLDSNNEYKKLKKEHEELKEKYEKLEKENDELKAELKEYKKLKKGALNSIRAKARKRYTEYFDLFCVHCKNSDKTIIEICHIKPVCEFALDATESEINALHNLISLCPNCHTGLDKSKNPEIIKTAIEHSEKILSLNIKTKF